jgi:hypothetical protein
MESIILKHPNPRANPKNALQFTELDRICCDGKKNAIVCRYKATITSVGSTTAVSTISIGGTAYTLPGSYLVAQERYRNELQQAIVDLVQKTLGYTADGNIFVSYSGTTLTIETDFSNISFDYVNTSATPFVPYVCKFIGEIDASTCAAAVAVTAQSAASGSLVLDVYSSTTISNISITDGTSSAFNNNPASGNADNTVVTRNADGSWHLVVTGGAGGALWENDVTITVTLTLVGCPTTFVLTRAMTFPNIP